MAAGDPHGLVLGGWEPVREAFADNLASGRDVGAGVAVYHRGQLVVDLRGGFFDRSRTAPYAHDTLQLVFSTTKGVTAIAVGMCVDRGLLDYDEKVSAYWPEFAAAGKGDITVSQLLSHQAGLFSVDAPVTLADALDWATITGRLAEQAPLWEPGTTHGYHALTYGWLAGELVRDVARLHCAQNRAVLRRDSRHMRRRRIAAAARHVAHDNRGIAGDEAAEMARNEPGVKVVAPAGR